MKRLRRAQVHENLGGAGWHRAGDWQSPSPSRLPTRRRLLTIPAAGAGNNLRNQPENSLTRTRKYRGALQHRGRHCPQRPLNANTLRSGMLHARENREVSLQMHFETSRLRERAGQQRGSVQTGDQCSEFVISEIVDQDKNKIRTGRLRERKRFEEFATPHGAPSYTMCLRAAELIRGCRLGAGLSTAGYRGISSPIPSIPPTHIP